VTGKKHVAIRFIWSKPLLTVPVLRALATRQPIGDILAKPRVAPKKATPIAITANQRLYTFIPYIVISGGCLKVTRDEAIAILQLPKDNAVDIILALAEKAEKYDQLWGKVSPTTPSGMTPPYLKPNRGKRKKRPGRKKGHEGVREAPPFRGTLLVNCT
jgi:hypothetical protein